jgi:hypothetical protein
MLETGANIAIIFLIIQFLIVVVLALAVTILLTVMTKRVRGKVEQVMPTIQSKTRQLSNTTESVSQKVAEPFIRLEQSQARMAAMFRRATAFGSGPAQSNSYQDQTKATEE